MKITMLRGSFFVGVLAMLCSALFALPANAAAYDDCDKLTLCLYQNHSYAYRLQVVKPGESGNLAQIDNPGSDARLNGKVGSHKLAASQSGCFTGFERCADGKLCLFREKNGRGAMFETVEKYRQYSGGWETGVQSVRNRTAQAVCFYNDPDWSGSWQPSPSAPPVKGFRVNRGDTTSLEGVYAGTFGSHQFTTATMEHGCTA